MFLVLVTKKRHDMLIDIADFLMSGQVNQRSDWPEHFIGDLLFFQIAQEMFSIFCVKAKMTWRHSLNQLGKNQTQSSQSRLW